jgi:hypothetical protein
MAAENVLATQITVGMIGAGFLQFLKSREWLPFLNQHSKALNHIVLATTSAAGAIGVNAVWSSSEHSLTITGLSLATIAAGLWVWAKQWTVQYLVHRGAFGAVSGAAPAASPDITGGIGAQANPGKIPPAASVKTP